jgi:predicted GIY-YIG superfamily endonuclease
MKRQYMQSGSISLSLSDISSTCSSAKRTRGARTIVYTEVQPSRSATQKREAALKKLPRAQKLALAKESPH